MPNQYKSRNALKYLIREARNAGILLSNALSAPAKRGRAAPIDLYKGHSQGKFCQETNSSPTNNHLLYQNYLPWDLKPCHNHSNIPWNKQQPPRRLILPLPAALHPIHQTTIHGVESTIGGNKMLLY